MPSPPFQPGSQAPARVIGLLGGVGSGKSAAASLIAGDSGLVLSADLIAHEVLREPEVVSLVTEAFGEAVLDADGFPDRAALASHVFDAQGGDAARSRLEDWIHPRVRAKIVAEMARAKRAGMGRIVLDVPLLLENEARHGLTGLCDVLVFIEAEEETRIRRTRESRGWQPGEVARREAAQLPLDAKRSRADLVIHNNGTLEDLARAVLTLGEKLDAP